MRNTLFLFLIINLPIISFGQTKSIDSVKYSLSFKLGYFYPSKSSFQNFYSQSLADFPLSSVTIELEYNYEKALHWFVETKVIHNQLDGYMDRRLLIIPTNIGIKQFYENSEHSNFFAGIGAGFYWIQMIFNGVLVVDEYGTILKEHEVFYKSYFGVGIKPCIGFDFKISNYTKLGIQFDYDISYIGNADKGGLGNIGGLLTNLFINFEL